AFPAVVKTISVTQYNTAASSGDLSVGGTTVNGFNVYNSTNVTGYYWQAWGY
ncbi:unnamed protein product, partial [marine sediment metagenome]